MISGKVTSIFNLYNIISSFKIGFTLSFNLRFTIIMNARRYWLPIKIIAVLWPYLINRVIPFVLNSDYNNLFRVIDREAS
jgi:hypothetical protein